MDTNDCTFFKAAENLAQIVLPSERISHTTWFLKIMCIVRAESQLKHVQKYKERKEVLSFWTKLQFFNVDSIVKTGTVKIQSSQTDYW